MTDTEKAKAYEMALEAARKELGVDRKEWEVVQRVLHNIFPELSESEDERMLREFNDYLCEEIECRTYDIRDEKDLRTLNMLYYVKKNVGTWLEKQKTSEEALEYLRQTHSPSEVSDFQAAMNIAVAKAYDKGVADTLEKQKEPHYTKRNALFDKCVENCDQEVMKEVSDKVDEMLGKEQKSEQYEIDVLKKHITKDSISELAHTVIVRNGWEIVEKEQKPDDDPLDDPKFLKGFDTGREVQRIFDEQKLVECSEEDAEKAARDYANENPGMMHENDGSVVDDYDTPYYNFLAGYRWTKSHIRTVNATEWSEEDEMMVKSIVNVLKRFEHQGATDMKIDWLQNKLKSLRPQSHWKPSEEQMDAIDRCVDYLEESDNEDAEIMESLQEQLKSIQ